MWLKRIGGVLTGGFAVVAASLSALGFVFPDLLSTAFALPVWLVGFMIVASTLAFVTVARARKRPQGPPEPIPDRLFTLLLIAGVVAVGCGIAGAIITRGYSADSPSTAGCRWPIVTDHGSDVRCVSHARWLEVKNGFFHIGLGTLGLFSSIFCGVWSRMPKPLQTEDL